MRSHDLARLLLELPNLPVAVQAGGYLSPDDTNAIFGDSLRVGLVEVESRVPRFEVLIGVYDGSSFHLDKGRYILRKMYYGSVTVDDHEILSEKRRKR